MIVACLLPVRTRWYYCIQYVLYVVVLLVASWSLVAGKATGKATTSHIIAMKARQSEQCTLQLSTVHVRASIHSQQLFNNNKNKQVYKNKNKKRFRVRVADSFDGPIDPSRRFHQDPEKGRASNVTPLPPPPTPFPLRLHSADIGTPRKTHHVSMISYHSTLFIEHKKKNAPHVRVQSADILERPERTQNTIIASRVRASKHSTTKKKHSTSNRCTRQTHWNAARESKTSSTTLHGRSKSCCVR